MMRPPGSILPLSTATTQVKTTRQYNGSVSSVSLSIAESSDIRPAYPRGARAKIGGKLWIYPTPYVHKSRKVTSSGGSFTGYLADGRYSTITVNKVDGNAIADSYLKRTLDLSAIESYNVRSAAQVKALNKIGDAKANIAEDLATYLQTAAMFKSKAKLLHDILRNFKNGTLGAYINRSARDLAKNGDKVLAGAYLEYVYGWKPLVSDVYETYQLLKNYADGAKPIILHGHGGQRLSSTYDSGRVKTSLTEWTQAVTTETYKGTCDLYGRVNPDYYAFRVINQLGLLNPAAFAWELTPWSFVVDWFIPIGPVLTALTAPMGLNFISGTSATRCSRVIEGQHHLGVMEAGMAGFEDKPAPYTVTDELYARDIHSTWPFPTPYLNLNPLAGDRSYKALALAIANLRR